jgi:hypothetical protein
MRATEAGGDASDLKFWGTTVRFDLKPHRGDIWTWLWGVSFAWMENMTLSGLINISVCGGEPRKLEDDF